MLTLEILTMLATLEAALAVLTQHATETQQRQEHVLKAFEAAKALEYHTRCAAQDAEIARASLEQFIITLKTEGK